MDSFHRLEKPPGFYWLAMCWTLPVAGKVCGDCWRKIDALLGLGPALFSVQAYKLKK